MNYKYIVSAFKLNEEFTNEEEARAFFNSIKSNFTYCELKRVFTTNGYYAKSIKIYIKRN